MDWTPAPVVTCQLQCFSNPNWFAKSGLWSMWKKSLKHGDSIDSPQRVLTQSSSDLVDESSHGRCWILAVFFIFFRFKVQITNLRHIHWKTPDVDMFATPCTWSWISICPWDGFNSLMLHYVQTHNTYRLHSIAPWFIPAWPWLHQLSTAENHEHGSQVFISKTFLREAFGKILHLHVACMCPDFDKTLNHLSCKIRHHPGIPMKSLNICGVPR